MKTIAEHLSTYKEILSRKYLEGAGVELDEIQLHAVEMDFYGGAIAVVKIIRSAALSAESDKDVGVSIAAIIDELDSYMQDLESGLSKDSRRHTERN